jgi:hypothetical protein
LARRDEIERYLAEGDTALAALQQRTRLANPALTRRLEEARRSSPKFVRSQ